MRILLAAFCFFSLLQWSGDTEVRAAFALGGSTITQSGTDADLSGLAGVAGVTTLTIGTGADGRTIYDIGNRQLVVTGNLTISPELEAVYAGTASPRSVFRFASGSTTTIDGEFIENGVTRYSERLFLWSPYQNGACCNNFGVEIQNGSTFNWTGGAMRVGSSLQWENGANITTTGAILIQDKNSDNQLRMEDTNWTSNSFTFRGNDITFIAIPTQLEGYQPQGSRGALGFSGSTPNVDFPIRNFSSNGSNDSDIRFWQGCRPIVTNSATGTDLLTVPHISGNGSSYGVAILQQDVRVSLIDEAGSAVSGAAVFTRDTDNGNRETYNRESHTVDATADRTYYQTSDGSGQTPVYTIVNGYNIVNTGNGDAANTGNYAWDFRGKNNDNSDLFDFNVWSYNHQYAVFEGELKGAATKELSRTLFTDPAITETNQATVAAYTGITVNHTADTITIGAGETYTVRDLYDYVKYNKTLSANIEEPSIDTTAITSPDGRNFISTYRIIVDGTLVQDPELESLTFDATVTDQALTFRNGSVHDLGQVITEGGVTRVSVGTALVTEFTGNSNFNDPSLRYESGSTLNWNGGKMELAGTTYYDSGSTININQGEHEITNSGQLIRSFTTGLTINDFDLKGGALIFAEQPTSVVGFVPSLAILNEGGRNDYAALIYGPDTGNGTANTVTLENFEGVGNPNDIGFIDGSRFVLLNPNDGSGVSILPWLQNSPRSDAYGTIEKDLEVNISDPSGTPIQNAKVYLQDYDNGNRENQQGFDDTADKIYESLTDASGQVTDRIITAIINELNNNGLAPLTYDLRSKNNDNTDTFDVHKWAYNYEYGVSTQTLVGKGTLVVDWTLFTDNNIAETSKAVVDAYTNIETLDKLYDRAKSYKVDNIAYPAINFQVIDGAGSQLNLGSKNLVVDGTAASAFAINTATNTITIDATAMNCTGGNFTSLVTTGLVTFVNGAGPGTCIFTDSVGTNGVLTLTGLLNANVLIYDDAAVADDTISYQTNQTGTVTIPFNATSSTDYQVVVRRQGFSEVNFEFDPSPGGFFTFPISQFRSLTIEGTPIFADTGDLAKISMDFTGLKINIGDFTIPVQEFYDTLQDYENTESGMKAPRIANYDGNDKALLLNTYQLRSRDGATTVPGVNGFIFAETGGVLDAGNGTVQFLANDSATVDKQEQIIKMIEAIQGSNWDNNAEMYTFPLANLTDMAGLTFDPNTDSLSNIVQSMLDTGVLDVNTAKDLVR